MIGLNGFMEWGIVASGSSGSSGSSSSSSTKQQQLLGDGGGGGRRKAWSSRVGFQSACGGLNVWRFPENCLLACSASEVLDGGAN